MLNVLLVEDEILFAKSVLRRLEREGHQATIASTISESRAFINKQTPDVIMLDVRLPDGSGLDLLTELRAKEGEWQRLPIVMMTAYGELDDAVSAMKLGATDYLKKPVDLDELVLMLSKLQHTQELNQQLDYSQVRESHGLDNIRLIGKSRAVQTIREHIQRIVQLVDRDNVTSPVLLISGETGTGKDVVARLYHQSSNWHNKPFVHVDCAALPAELIEAELFGYERGAFTNAHQPKAGLIEVAEDGSLFLDEVGELPLELQAKLLNVLERRKVRRLGSTKEHPVSAHFIAATNRKLSEMVEQGKFRSDLYFRMNVLELVLPSLRDRREDIAELAHYYTQQIAKRYGLVVPELTQPALLHLERYDWPGNIRELQHVLERAVMLSHNGTIDETDLLLQQLSPTKDASNQTSSDFEHMTLEQVEKLLIEKALSRTAGNVSKAARQLGLTRMAMRYRMEKYKL